MNVNNAKVTISTPGGPEVETTVGELGQLANKMKSKSPDQDVFAWANNMVTDRDDYKVDLFAFNKNMVVYSLNIAKDLTDRIRQIFIDGIMEDILEGADRGMNVHRYENTLKGDGNIAWLPLKEVARADSVLLWVEEHAIDIEKFDTNEHDHKRLKGIFARFTKPGAKTFYSFKTYASSQAITGRKDFVMNSNRVSTFNDEVGFSIQPSSQVLLIDGDLFVFNQTKFEQLFDTKPHMTAVANRNGAIIDDRFDLSIPLIVQEIAILAQNDKTSLKKLSEIDPYAMSQEQVLEAIDEYGVPLMLDDLGKIIIMDAKDVTRFLDVLSDNYLSGINGHYLAKSKKPFEGEQDGPGL